MVSKLGGGSWHIPFQIRRIGVILSRSLPTTFSQSDIDRFIKASSGSGDIIKHHRIAIFAYWTRIDNTSDFMGRPAFTEDNFPRISCAICTTTIWFELLNCIVILLLIYRSSRKWLIERLIKRAYLVEHPISNCMQINDESLNQYVASTECGEIGVH